MYGYLAQFPDLFEKDLSVPYVLGFITVYKK